MNSLLFTIDNYSKFNNRTLIHILSFTQAKKPKAKKQLNQHDAQHHQNHAKKTHPPKNESNTAIPKQQPKSHKNNSNETKLRSDFVNNIELPLSQLHYNQTAEIVMNLINEEKYNVSVAYSVDAFVEYRMKLLIWVYEIKTISLTMSKNSTTPELALSTVIFDVFNSILERLDGFHEKTVTTFEKAVHRMFDVRQMDFKRRVQKAHQVQNKLKKSLRQYEATVARKTRGILRSALSFL